VGERAAFDVPLDAWRGPLQRRVFRERNSIAPALDDKADKDKQKIQSIQSKMFVDTHAKTKLMPDVEQDGRPVA